MPLFSTPTQFLILAMVLVAGWLFGLASHPGGRKWRDRYAAERDAHAGSRHAAEHARADDRLRIAELESENARLARAAPVTAATIARPAPVTAASPLSPAARGERRGWFDWAPRP